MFGGISSVRTDNETGQQKRKSGSQALALSMVKWSTMIPGPLNGKDECLPKVGKPETLLYIQTKVNTKSYK